MSSVFPLGCPCRHQLWIAQIGSYTVPKFTVQITTDSACLVSQYLFTLMHLSVPVKGQTRAWIVQRTPGQILACPFPHNHHCVGGWGGTMSRYSLVYIRTIKMCVCVLVFGEFGIRSLNTLVLISYWAVLYALLRMHSTMQPFERDFKGGNKAS